MSRATLAITEEDEFPRSSTIWASDLTGALAEITCCLRQARTGAVHWCEIEDRGFAVRCRVEPDEILAFLEADASDRQGPFLGWNPPTADRSDVQRRGRDARYSPFCNWWAQWTAHDAPGLPLHVRAAFAVVVAANVLGGRVSLSAATITLHRSTHSLVPPGRGRHDHEVVDVDALRRSAGFRPPRARSSVEADVRG